MFRKKKKCAHCCGDAGKVCIFRVRLCEVDGKVCVFHRWVEEDQVMLTVKGEVSPEEMRRLISDSCVTHRGSTEVLRATFALVEYKDGSVGKVKPELVTFLDKEV